MHEINKPNNSINKIGLWVTNFFIILAPLENIRQTEGFLYIIAIAILGYLVLSRHSFRLNNSRYFLFYIIYMFLACIWSPNQAAFRTLIVAYAELIFLILQLQFDYTESDIRKIKKAFLAQNVLLIVLCSIFGSYMDNRFWLKSAVSGADPNYLSGWFIIPLCISMEYLFSKETKSIYKVLLVMDITISFYYIMQSASKSGLIVNAFVIILSGLYTMRSTVKQHPIRALFILGLLMYILYLGFISIPDYFMYRLSSGSGTLSGRTTIWKELIDILLDNPFGAIFGFGTASVTLYTSSGLSAHNTFLDILFNYGIVGLLCIVFYLFNGIKSKIRLDYYAIITCACMSILVFTLPAFNTRFFMLMLFMIGNTVAPPPPNNYKLSS